MTLDTSLHRPLIHSSSPMSRILRSSLSRQSIFYAALLFIILCTAVSMLRSWVRSKHYFTGHGDEISWHRFGNESSPDNDDSQPQFNRESRIEHIPEDITNADHCVFYNFLKSSNTEVPEHEPITLALHSTINYAGHLIKQAESWDDMISYSVYLFPRHDEALQALSTLHKCHDAVNRKVSIHLVWNRNFLFENCMDDEIIRDITSISDGVESCSDFDLDNVLSKLKAVRNPFGSYPINIMRNEARRGAATRLHLIGDIETRYSPEFAANVRPLAQQLLDGQLGRAVLVYRRFEIDESVTFPRDLQTFSELLADKKIFQFHEKHYKVGHYIPNLEQWLEYSLNNDELRFDNVSYTSTEWEPQFIMKYDAPYHYEHVPTRMMDHQFLCYELCRAGYSYLLMTHVYNIHPGIKLKSTPLEKSLSIFGQAQTDPTMRKFRAYINARYPIYQNTKCPSWKSYF